MSDTNVLDNNIISSSDVVVVDNIQSFEDPVIDYNKTCYDPVNDKTIFECNLTDDNKYITGFCDDGLKARYSFEHHKWFYGHDISSLFLIPFNQRTVEEHKAISSKGGTATQDNIRTKKTLNEIARDMLNVNLSKSMVDDILGDGQVLIGGDATAGAVMMAKMLQTAYAGSFKAAEFVRDTAGYKPKNEVELNAEIMSDSDRSLMDKIGKRLELTG